MILSHLNFLKSIMIKPDQFQYRTLSHKSNVLIQSFHSNWNFRLRLEKKHFGAQSLFTYELFLARQYGSEVLRNDIYKHAVNIIKMNDIFLIN
jgi:hypothetical protein